MTDYRGPVLATGGIVATEHPLATQAGIDVLRRGGNAFDAALAVSGVLPVVKPARSHLGGDAYVLLFRAADKSVTAVCSGGRAPAAATLERYAGGMPRRGGATVAVPGLVDAWQAIAGGWCTMPLRDLLQPAIAYARDGFPVSRELALVLGAAQGMFTKYTGLAEALNIAGRAPRMGETLRQPALAHTLAAIADTGRGAFYEGDVAKKLAAGVQAAGGSLSAADLASHSADVLQPLSVTYRGYAVHETPPNSQGLILLEELKILEGFDLARLGHLSADAVHHMVEAKKLAFEDRQRFAGDPAFTSFDPRALLTDEHAARRRAEIDPHRARPAAEAGVAADTTGFAVIDGAGNACSFIQSIFAPFGSCVCIDGIIMNNRMTGFSLEPSHPNALAPGKRTMHTLNAYLVFRDGALYLAGCTPGGDFQVQTNLQVLTGVLDYGLDPQDAVDAPRWGHLPEALIVEEELPAATREGLAHRGHDVRPAPRATNPTGRPQLVSRDASSGVLAGGSDSRGEGCAAGW